MPSPLRKFLSFVAEKRQVLKSKLDEARKKHLKRGSGDSDPSRNGEGAEQRGAFPTGTGGCNANRTAGGASPVRRRAYQVHHTRYASDHPYASDPRRWVRRSNSSSSSSSASRRRSGSPGPPGCGSVLYNSAAAGGSLSSSGGGGGVGSPTSQPRSNARSSGPSSSGNSRRNSNYSDDGVLLVADVDDGAPSLSPPLTVLRLQEDEDPAHISVPPGLLSGWSREGVSESEIMAILLNPVQQRIALKMMLGEAMRFSWQLQVAHWQYCPQPLAVPQLYSTSQEGEAAGGGSRVSQGGSAAEVAPPPSIDDVPVAALDMETLWFEFDCVWRTLVSDVFQYLHARTQRPAPMVVAVPYEVLPEGCGDAAAPSEEEEDGPLGRATVEEEKETSPAESAAATATRASSKSASPRSRDVLQWSVALAEVVQVLHSLDLFQRLHPVQQDVSVLTRKWAEYYQEYQRYTERITEQYYANCGYHPCSPPSSSVRVACTQDLREGHPCDEVATLGVAPVVAHPNTQEQETSRFSECPAAGGRQQGSAMVAEAQQPETQQQSVCASSPVATTSTAQSTAAVVVRLPEGDVFGSGQPSSCGQTPSNGGSVGYLHSSTQLLRYQSYYSGSGEQELSGPFVNPEVAACTVEGHSNNGASSTDPAAASPTAALPVVAFHVPPPPQPPTYLDIPSVKASMALAKKRAKEERRLRKQQEAPPSVILMGLAPDGGPSNSSAASPNNAGSSRVAKDTLSGGTHSGHSDTLSLRRSSLRGCCPDEDSPYLALSWAAGNSPADRHRVIAIRRRRRLHAMLAANAMVGY